MQRKKQNRVCLLIVTLICLLLVTTLAPAVYADTNGSEIQITEQPDKLILQLGPQWAGVEFELKTDAGVFPVPVVVDSSGILKMDLGGSKPYTLSCLASSVATPGPTSAEPGASPQQPAPRSWGVAGIPGTESYWR